MVMTGEQAKSAILDDGLASTMEPGGTIVLTATIRPSEAREIGKALEGSEACTSSTALSAAVTPVRKTAR